MMNYENMAKNYNLHRRISRTIMAQVLSEINIKNKTVVLDFGCGTGNYAYYLKNIKNLDLYGIDSSLAMLNYFKEKNPELLCFLGNEKHTPFLDNTFDYIYMIDVIHHVNNIDILFKELFRILKPNGKICICTENEQQLKEKYWISYFPTILKYDLKRFWSIKDIVMYSSNNGLDLIKITETKDTIYGPISDFFMKQIECKAMSVLHLISENDYKIGLKKMREDYNTRQILHQIRGYSFIWFRKGVN